MTSNYILEKEIVTINTNSVDCTGETSDFVFVWNPDSYEKYTHACVLQASIPKSFYNIDAPYNTVQLQENQTVVDITITPKNYNANTFLTEFQTALNTVSPNHWQYAITYDAMTSKYSFTCAQGNPRFIFVWGLYRALGFNDSTTYTFANNKLTSPNVVDFSYGDALFIRSDITTGKDNVLQEIYTEGVAVNSCIVFRNQSPYEYSKLLTTKKPNHIHIWVTDADSTIVPLNGAHILITLLLYRMDPINTAIKNYIIDQTKKG